MLDECHGAVDPVTGEYKYYTAPGSECRSSIK